MVIRQNVATRGSSCPVFGEVLGFGFSCCGFVQVFLYSISDFLIYQSCISLIDRALHILENTG
jgi:hypothetical protein